MKEGCYGGSFVFAEVLGLGQDVISFSYGACSLFCVGEFGDL